MRKAKDIFASDVRFSVGMSGEKKLAVFLWGVTILAAFEIFLDWDAVSLRIAETAAAVLVSPAGIVLIIAALLSLRAALFFPRRRSWLWL